MGVLGELHPESMLQDSHASLPEEHIPEKQPAGVEAQSQ